MKKSKFAEEQVVGILPETDRDPVATVDTPLFPHRHAFRPQVAWRTARRDSELIQPFNCGKLALAIASCCLPRNPESFPCQRRPFS